MACHPQLDFEHMMPHVLEAAVGKIYLEAAELSQLEEEVGLDC